MDSSELQAHLEALHRESYGWALACCNRNPTDAESVLQTVYLKVLEGKARYDGKAAFKTWLFAVIRNTAAERRRRNILGALRLAGYSEAAARGPRPELPDEALYRSELQSQFQRSVALLTERQRQVLQLVFYHDLSLAEAADVMSVSTGSARTHYERGKKRLRQLMSEMGVLDESRLGRTKDRGALP